MRINAKSTLTAQDVWAAASQARTQYGQDIYVEELTETPRGSITFYCASMHGRYATQRNGTRAATWAAWGYVIAELFNRDPHAHIGQYRGVGNFTEQIRRAANAHNMAMAVGVTRRKDSAGSDTSFLELLNW